MPLQAKGRAHDPEGGIVQVSMFRNDGRVLSAQFQDSRTHIAPLCKVAENAHAHIQRAGESNTIHFRAVDQCLPEAAAGTGNIVENTLRHPGIPQAFSDQARHPGGVGCRLENNSISGYQRCSCWAAGERTREVERADYQPHTVWAQDR